MNTLKKIIYIGLFTVLLEITVFSSVSLVGPTGFLNVPSPDTAPIKTAEGGMHWTSYGFGGNSSYNVTSIKGNVGVGENFEIGFEKTSDSGTLVRDPGIVVSGKASWKLSENIKMAGGVIIDSTSGNYSSAYGVLGADVAFFGMGFNFGGESGLPYSIARMGGYDITDVEPEKVFFFAGAKLGFGDSGSLTVAYNGDSVALGFLGELPMEDGKRSAVEVGWLIEGDYEDLYKKYLNPKYEHNKFFIGVSGEF